MQMLLKQSTTTIDVLQKTFNLTDEEKYLLLEAGVGEGLFFAGLKHVAIKSGCELHRRPDHHLRPLTTHGDKGREETVCRRETIVCRGFAAEDRHLLLPR